MENLKFLNSETEENSRLPPSIKPVGPYVTSDTALQVILLFWLEHEMQCNHLNVLMLFTQSLVSSLHTVIQGVSITGQTGSKSALEKNAGVFLNPDQPLVQVCRSYYNFCVA